mmetsp:Transcript_35677/g.77055  ORF Transcript_35677/g.77055 Transcript_35677/m.77055 type:complete len:551 (+) Transcript_35677:1574-3226(+)
MGLGVALPLRGHPLHGVALEVVGLSEGGLELIPSCFLHAVQFGLAGDALRDELLGEEALRAGVLRDLLVELRLGVVGVQGLVVPEASVADDVQDHVGAPGLAPIGGELESSHDRGRIVAVAVEDWAFEGLAQVGAVHGGSVIDGVGREADLVVDHNVDGATDGEVADTLQLHGLVADALSGERSISVEEDRKDLLLVLLGVARVELLRSGPAQGDGVDSLQVRRVGFEGHCGFLAVGELPDVRGAQVVLHIARKSPIGRLHDVHQLVEVVVGALELSEHLHQGLADHVGEHVKTTSMGHANDDILHAHVHCLRDGSVNADNGGLTSINTESLGGLVLGAQEGLEAIDFAEGLVDGHELLLLGRHQVRVLDAGAKPLHLLEAVDVEVLEAELVGVGLLQRVDQVPQGHLAAHAGEADIDLLVHVRFGKTMEGWVQLWHAVGDEELAPVVDAERIQVRGLVAPLLVGADQVLEATAHPRSGDVGAARAEGLTGRVREAGLHAGLSDGVAGLGEGRAAARLKSLEILVPALIERGRVGLPLSVETLQVHRVRA